MPAAWNAGEKVLTLHGHVFHLPFKTNFGCTKGWSWKEVSTVALSQSASAWSAGGHCVSFPPVLCICMLWQYWSSHSCMRYKWTKALGRQDPSKTWRHLMSYISLYVSLYLMVNNAFKMDFEGTHFTSFNTRKHKEDIFNNSCGYKSRLEMPP